MTIASRIDKLEREAGKAGRGFVIGTFEGETRQAALAEVGIVPTENDTVIFIGRLGERDGRDRHFSQFEVKP